MEPTDTVSCDRQTGAIVPLSNGVLPVTGGGATPVTSITGLGAGVLDALQLALNADNGLAQSPLVNQNLGQFTGAATGFSFFYIGIGRLCIFTQNGGSPTNYPDDGDTLPNGYMDGLFIDSGGTLGSAITNDGGESYLT